MKLVYLYLQQFKVFHGAEFNFDANVRFELVRGGGHPKLQVLVDQVLPERFFKLSDNDYSLWADAVVGSNGSGKTSLAVAVDKLIAGHLDLGNFIAVFQEGPKQYGCYYRLLKYPWTEHFLQEGLDAISKDGMAFDEIHVESETQDLSFAYFPFRDAVSWTDLKDKISAVYYSPAYTSQHEFGGFGGTSFDISTTAWLRDDDGRGAKNFSKTHSNVSLFDSFKARDTLAVLEFSAAVQANADETILREFPVPKGFAVTVNSGVKSAVQQSLDKGMESERANNKIFHEDYLERDEGALRKEDERLKIAEEVYAGAKIVFDDQVSKDLFYRVFIAFAGAYLQDANWRDEIRAMVDGSFVFKLIKFMRSVAEDNQKKHYYYERIMAIRRKVLKFLNKTLEDRECAYVHGKIKALRSLLQTFDREMREPDGKTPQMTGGLCWKFVDGEFPRVARQLVLDHAAAKTTVDFLTLELDPHLSTGEMCYMSLWGRLMQKCDYLRKIGGPRNILLFMDEAETSLHPSLQRKLVWLTIWFFGAFCADFKVQVIYLSHSPLVLSDIPIGNVVLLRREFGSARTEVVPPDKASMRNTFAANVFDLFKMSFFIGDSSIGAFATEKLRSVSSYLVEHARHERSLKATYRVAEMADPQMRMIVDQLGDRFLWRYFSDRLQVGGSQQVGI